MTRSERRAHRKNCRRDTCGGIFSGTVFGMPDPYATPSEGETEGEIDDNSPSIGRGRARKKEKAGEYGKSCTLA